MRIVIDREELRADQTPANSGDSVPLDAVDAPGTYICDWSGHLLRVSDSNPAGLRFTALRQPSATSWTVTRISDNPRLPRFQAKALATSFGITTNF